MIRINAPCVIKDVFIWGFNTVIVQINAHCVSQNVLVIDVQHSNHPNKPTLCQSRCIYIDIPHSNNPNNAFCVSQDVFIWKFNTVTVRKMGALE